MDMFPVSQMDHPCRVGYGRLTRYSERVPLGLFCSTSMAVSSLPSDVTAPSRHVVIDENLDTKRWADSTLPVPADGAGGLRLR